MSRVIKPHQHHILPKPWAPEPAVEAASELPIRSTDAGPQAALRAAEQDARRQGLAEGIRTAEEAYQTKLARIDALSESLQRDRDEFFARIEPELVRLAVSIAEKVIGRELELNPETVVDLVRGATKRLRDRETLRVSVNPRDVQRVREARSDLISAVDGIRKLDVVEDRRVDPGGCVIESPSGTLDARISTQVDEISRALGDLLPGNSGETPPSDAGAPPDRGETSDPGLRSIPPRDQPD